MLSTGLNRPWCLLDGLPVSQWSPVFLRTIRFREFSDNVYRESLTLRTVAIASNVAATDRGGHRVPLKKRTGGRHSQREADFVHLKAAVHRWVPALASLRCYRPSDLPSDLVAGLIVAIMLVPQGMAYASLAGLPPQMGLYASFLPIVLYALFGTSSTLAVGPVAIISLLVASGVSQLAETGTPAYASYAVTLALMVGIIQGALGLVRLGFVVNFLSHAVLSGFTSAAALVIAASQLKHVLGVEVDRQESFPSLLSALASKTTEANLATLAIGAAAVLVLLGVRYGAEPVLKAVGVASSWRVPLAKLGPFFAGVSGIWITSSLPGSDPGVARS